MRIPTSSATGPGSVAGLPMPVRTTVLLRYAHGPGQAHAGLCVTVILAVKRHGFEFISHRLSHITPVGQVQAAAGQSPARRWLQIQVLNQICAD